MKLLLSLIMAPILSIAGITDADVRAVGIVESGLRHGVHGDGGKARSAWQIHKDAWWDVNKIRSRHDLKVYSWGEGTRNAFISKVYAKTYLQHIHSRLRSKLGRDPELREVYAAYNWGITRYITNGCQFNRAPKNVRERAIRVQNLR